MIIPSNIYLFKVENKNTRKRCEKCIELTIKIPERRQLHLSGVFIVNSEHISHLFLLFALLTLNKKMLAGIPLISLMEPEKAIAGKKNVHLAVKCFQSQQLRRQGNDRFPFFSVVNLTCGW